MKKVITYGTFDLLHHGHLNLLKRAKELGDYLIVGVTGESYDKGRGKLNVHQNTIERVENVKDTGYADEIIIEEFEGQKIDDIQKYEIDIFTIGSDWRGKFDYLNEFCQVVYLDRTKGVSSTQLRGEKNKIIRLGVIGSGRIANRFIPESKYVSGVNVVGVYNPNLKSAKEFGEKHELKFHTNEFKELIDNVDTVYIASPHLTHYSYIKKCLEYEKHVLCEKPMVLNADEAEELFDLAAGKSLILMEGIKTAYAPAFQQLIALIKSGVIGTVKDVEASFTKLSKGSLRELTFTEAGGSITELSSYTLLPIIKLFGKAYKDVHFFSYKKDEIDLFTKGIIHYEQAIASFKVGLGVKTEGELVISGTKGYAYVPAPWWKTEYFELRFENLNETRKYFYRFDGDGLRYELNDFISLVNNPNKNFFKISRGESIAISRVIEKFRNNENIILI